MSYDTTISGLGPVAWWKLADSVGSSTATDSSGHGLTLAKSGTVTFGTTGPGAIYPDTCALFDGSTGYLQATVSSGLITALSGSFTVLCWANASSWVANGPQIFSIGYNGSNGTDSAFQISLGPSYAPGLTIGFYGDDWTANPSLSAGWHCFAVTINRGASTSVRSLYVDGVYKSQNTSGGNLTIASGSQVNIGQIGGGNYWNGDIAQVAVFNSVLTSGQITALAGSSFDALIESYTSTTGIYWPLEDASGTTNAADASGNGHTLSTNNFTFGTAGIVPTDIQTCAALTGGISNGSSSYEPSYSAVTIGAIVNFATLPNTSNYPPLLSNLTSSSGVNLIINGNQGDIVEVDWGNGSSTDYVLGSIPLVSGHSYLISSTWNGSTITLYQYDLTGNNEIPPVTSSLSGSFTSPQSWSVGGYAMTGNIGRIFVLPVALSSTQIGGLATAAGYSPPIILTQGLIASLI